jgi:tRNA-dihydrouridine synthase
MSDDDDIRAAWEQTGADAVMIARGSFGDPWRFARLVGLRDDMPSPAEIADELRWVILQAEDHLGVERAGRYLRKFYPWYADALDLGKRERQPLVTAPTTADARAALDALESAEAPSLAA